MRIVIVDRDLCSLEVLIKRLEQENFIVHVADNKAKAMASIYEFGFQFLIGDSLLLLDSSFISELKRHSPLARLIALANNPSLTNMVEALNSGITDYFPKDQKSIPALLALVDFERNRLLRWRNALLNTPGAMVGA